MMINLKMLSQQLSIFNPQAYPSDNTSIHFSSIQFFEKGQESIDSEALYICYASVLNDSYILDFEMNFICIEDTQVPKMFMENCNFKFITVDACASPTKICNIINTFQASYMAMIEDAHLLIKVFNEEHDLKKLLDAAYSFVRNPMAVIDNSFRLIEHSGPSYINDASWDHLIAEGYSMDKTISQYTQNKIFLKANELKAPFVIKKGYLLYDEIYTPLVAEGKVSGALSIVASERPFVENDLMVAAFISNIISIEMQKRLLLMQTKSSIIDHLFTDVFEGKLNDSLRIHKSFNNLGIALKTNMYLLAIDIREFDTTKITIDYLRKDLEKIFTNDISTVYNFHIIVLLSRKHLLHFSGEESTRFIEFMNKYNLFGGLSCCFNDISTIKQHFKEAESASKMSRWFRPENRFLRFEDVIPFQIIDLASKDENLENLYDPLFKKLIEYDKQYSTEYCHTLFSYLKYNKSIQNAAKSIPVHRNTFLYRIKKIKEIFGCDFNDNEICFRLMLSYKINEYLKGTK